VPKTTKEAKRCGICSTILLLLGIALIIQAVLVPVALHRAVRHTPHHLHTSSLPSSRLRAHSTACLRCVCVVALCIVVGDWIGKRYEVG
jgi:hydrogenase-4 membrane subunit HyfE